MSRIPISFTLLLALAGFLAWASLFEVDQTVRARGTVIVQGHAQVIQSPEGGVLRELRVQEGDRVAKDQVLAVMDQQAVRAAVDEISAEIETNIIARLRATAELAGRRPDFGGLAKTYPQVALAQMALFDGNMAALQEEKGFAEAQLQVATDQLAQLRTLVKAGNASTAEVARAQREVLQIQGMITAIVERYRGQARKDIAEIEQQISTLEFRLAGRRTSLAFAELRAPQNGIVTKLQTNTLGAVLRPGDELMRLSPTGGMHLVEVQIAPADVGALQIGQTVTLQFDAFSSTIFGGLKGNLTYISADTITDSGPDGRPRTYYLGRIELAERQENQRITADQVRPGMQVTADIRSGTRTIMVYLAKPILRAFSGALSEK